MKFFWGVRSWCVSLQFFAFCCVFSRCCGRYWPQFVEIRCKLTFVVGFLFFFGLLSFTTAFCVFVAFRRVLQYGVSKYNSQMIILFVVSCFGAFCLSFRLFWFSFPYVFVTVGKYVENQALINRSSCFYNINLHWLLFCKVRCHFVAFCVCCRILEGSGV